MRSPGRITRSVLRSPDRKRVYNRRLFAVVAPRYDLVTRLLSFGRDEAWKRTLVASLPSPAGWNRSNVPGPVVLDLACGTGDITFLLASRYPSGRIEGIDLAEEMLTRARRRATRHGSANRSATGVSTDVPADTPTDGTLRFRRGDMNALEKPDRSVDIVTGGYALRNAPDLEVTLREVHRVLRPGGVAAFLEFSLPPASLHRAIQIRLLRFWGGLWGLFLHGDPEVYAYIARSLENYPDSRNLNRLLRGIGFASVTGRPLMAGFVRITRARKEAGRRTRSGS